MDVDDFATVKALRKAKKKEIQAWITEFEAREGRSPGSSDKEAVRSMYREFKDLETRLAALTDAGDGVGSSVGTMSATPGEAQPGSASGGDASGVHAAGVGGEEDVHTVKAERDSKKKEIKSWIKEFEEREGRSPTAEDKAPIKGLYRDFKSLERRLGLLREGETAAASSTAAAGEVIGAGIPVGDLEITEAEKDRVKAEIQAWIDDFEAREGRAALEEDMEEIRPLNERHKDLEHELGRLATQTSLEPSGTATTAVPTTPTILQNPKDEPTSVTPMFLSQTSSKESEISATAAEDKTEPRRDDADAESTSPVIPHQKDELDSSTPSGHSPASDTGVEIVMPAPEGGAVAYDGENDVGGHGGGGSDRADRSVAKGSVGEPGAVADEKTFEAASQDMSGASADLGCRDTRNDTLPDTSPLMSLSLDRPIVSNVSEPFPEVMAVTPTEGKSESPRTPLDRGSDVEENVNDTEEPLAVTPKEGTSENLTTLLDSGSDVEEKLDNTEERLAANGDGQSGRDDDRGGGDQLNAFVEGGLSATLPSSAREEDTETIRAIASDNKGDSPDDGELSGREEISVMVPANVQSLPLELPDSKPLTAQEARVRRMRARFLNMSDLIDEDIGKSSWAPNSIFSDEEGEVTATPEKGVGGARSRWAALGDAVAPNRQSLSPHSRWKDILNAGVGANNNDQASGQSQVDDDHKAADGHDIQPNTLAPDDGISSAWLTGQMSDLLLSQAPPPPPHPPPPPTGYAREYQDGVRRAKLTVTSVGVDEIEARERALKLQRLAEAREEANVHRVREANLLYREDQARQRVLALTNAKETAARAEKKAIVEIALARERALAPAFARARAGLETAIRAQGGRLREVFGELRPGETAGARRFRVDWRGVPQPVEIRLHCIRAVRDRLPRGSYVMLSSMAERLGGRVMRWSKDHYFDDHNDDDNMDTDGGDTRPAATLPVHHGGRYFDRELRLDQNVYQLCPSKSDVRPGNVMVFELFRLAGGDAANSNGGDANCGSSRHKGGELDKDTAVGWCVLPLADSRLRVVRGSFRIPLLRGEPNPNVDLHEGLEKLIASDLEVWLGNIYLDVRHLSREARLEGPGEEGGISLGGESFDVEYDYVRKAVRLGKGMEGTMASSVNRWMRWRRKDDTDPDPSKVGEGAKRPSTDALAGEVDVEAGEGGELITGFDAGSGMHPSVTHGVPGGIRGDNVRKTRGTAAKKGNVQVTDDAAATEDNESLGLSKNQKALTKNYLSRRKQRGSDASNTTSVTDDAAAVKDNDTVGLSAEQRAIAKGYLSRRKQKASDASNTTSVTDDVAAVKDNDTVGLSAEQRALAKDYLSRRMQKVSDASTLDAVAAEGNDTPGLSTKQKALTKDYLSRRKKGARDAPTPISVTDAAGATGDSDALSLTAKQKASMKNFVSRWRKKASDASAHDAAAAAHYDTLELSAKQKASMKKFVSRWRKRASDASVHGAAAAAHYDTLGLTAKQKASMKEFVSRWRKRASDASVYDAAAAAHYDTIGLTEKQKAPMKEFASMWRKRASDASAHDAAAADHYDSIGLSAKQKASMKEFASRWRKRASDASAHDATAMRDDDIRGLSTKQKALTKDYLSRRKKKAKGASNTINVSDDAAAARGDDTLGLSAKQKALTKDYLSRRMHKAKGASNTTSVTNDAAAAEDNDTLGLSAKQKSLAKDFLSRRRKKGKSASNTISGDALLTADAMEETKGDELQGGAEAVTKKSHLPRPSVFAPPPDGSWAGAALVAGGDPSDDGINADTTFDEECLSDDDPTRGSKFQFTPTGEAAVAVDMAAGAANSDGRYTRGAGLRRRGEGARWDSAALGTGGRGLSQRYGGGNAIARDSHVWTSLTNPAEMEYYRFAVAADPGTDAPATPAQIIRHKLRYLKQEILLDLHPRGWRVVEYWLAVMVFIGALWLRVYLHTMGQWFLLYSLGVPVFNFSPRLWEFAIKYMDRSSSLGVEIAFVSWGPTFVTLCFVTLAAVAKLWSLAACGGKGGGGGGGVPESVSRFVAAFGVAAAVDPYLLCIVDFLAGNYDCSTRCADYTSPTCRCHEGDAWKLYVRLDAEEGAGVSGVLLTVMIYAMVSMATVLILNQYLLYAHMNGRMLDIWRRLNASEDDFFVPHDLEVSAAELNHACERARIWRGPGGARREVVLHDFHVTEETPQEGAPNSPGGREGPGNNATRALTRAAKSPRWAKGTMAARGRSQTSRITTTHVGIYGISVGGNKSLHRQFLRTIDGTILEVFGEAGREVGWQLRSSLNALMRQEAGGGELAGSVYNEQGVFAGMLPAEVETPPLTPVA